MKIAVLTNFYCCHSEAELSLTETKKEQRKQITVVLKKKNKTEIIFDIIWRHCGNSDSLTWLNASLFCLLLGTSEMTFCHNLLTLPRQHFSFSFFISLNDVRVVILSAHRLILLNYKKKNKNKKTFLLCPDESGWKRLNFQWERWQWVYFL